MPVAACRLALAALVLATVGCAGADVGLGEPQTPVGAPPASFPAPTVVDLPHRTHGPPDNYRPPDACSVVVALGFGGSEVSADPSGELCGATTSVGYVTVRIARYGPAGWTEALPAFQWSHRGVDTLDSSPYPLLIATDPVELAVFFREVSVVVSWDAAATEGAAIERAVVSWLVDVDVATPDD